MITEMKRILTTILSIVFVAALSASAQDKVITSPDGNLKLTFSISADGTPQYSLDRGQTKVILPSGLGFELRGTIKASKLVFSEDGSISKTDAAPANSFHDGFSLESAEPLFP